jgi:hypothetical protein
MLRRISFALFALLVSHPEHQALAQSSVFGENCQALIARFHWDKAYPNLMVDIPKISAQVEGERQERPLFAEFLPRPDGGWVLQFHWIVRDLSPSHVIQVIPDATRPHVFLLDIQFPVDASGKLLNPHLLKAPLKLLAEKLAPTDILEISIHEQNTVREFNAAIMKKYFEHELPVPAIETHVLLPTQQPTPTGPAWLAELPNPTTPPIPSVLTFFPKTSESQDEGEEKKQTYDWKRDWNDILRKQSQLGEILAEVGLWSGSVEVFGVKLSKEDLAQLNFPPEKAGSFATYRVRLSPAF